MALFLALALTAAGCADEDEDAATDSSRETMTYEHVLEQLTERGVTASAESTTVDQIWTRVPGRQITVEGETVHVFQHESTDAALREAERIAPDGSSIGRHQVEWTGPPRFYRSGQIIVLYVGTNENLVGVLREVLGPPFAGAGAATSGR